MQQAQASQQLTLRSGLQQIVDKDQEVLTTFLTSSTHSPDLASRVFWLQQDILWLSVGPVGNSWAHSDHSVRVAHVGHVCHDVSVWSLRRTEVPTQTHYHSDERPGLGSGRGILRRGSRGSREELPSSDVWQTVPWGLLQTATGHHAYCCRQQSSTTIQNLFSI